MSTFETEKISLQQLFLFIAVPAVLVFTFWLAFAKIGDKAGDVVGDVVHGNSDDNCRLHIVYEIFTVTSTGVKRTLKYGISSQCDFITKDGNPRPEYQVPKIQAKPKYWTSKVAYTILFRNVPSRVAAKAIEQNLVNRHVATHRSMPAEQKRPFPK